MTSDLRFEGELKALISAVAAQAKKKDSAWAGALLKPLEGSAKELETASAKARDAEAAWKKRVGKKAKVIDEVAAACRAYQNHLRADLAHEDMAYAIMPFENAGGLDGALDRLLEAFEKRGVAADLPYARLAQAELVPARRDLDQLLLESNKEYGAWRDAAAKKHAAWARAWELAKRARRHLRAQEAARENEAPAKKIARKSKGRMVAAALWSN